MSVLKTLESKLAGLVEGTFSRAFRSEVRPVEIARKLAREMDEHRVQSLSRVYAPNEYAVWLSPEDRKQFEGYEDELKRELAGYLLEHARREKVSLATRPQIEFRTDAGANVHAAIGRRSFSVDDLEANLAAFVEHLKGLKPPQAKGHFIRKVCVSTSMGPGIQVSVD